MLGIVYLNKLTNRRIYSVYVSSPNYSNDLNDMHGPIESSGSYKTEREH